jgi:Tfp pilus assembly protein PilF
MKNLIILFLVSLSIICDGQSNKDYAKNKMDKAIELMDTGNTDDAIKLLLEAKKLDPDNYIYDYERAYAYCIKQDYKTSLDIYKAIVKYENATDQCYQMLGNLYDINGKPEKALKAYDKGLKKFPHSGRLFLEKGNVYLNQKKYTEALNLYESGIKSDPAFPSNYYRAALLFFNSSETVWAMIYGEIFMNLERDSKRTAEISKLLYDTYKNHIIIKNDTISVSFSKNNTITLSDLQDINNFKLPFAIGAYEPTLLLAITGEKEINIHSLDSIRTRFIRNYNLKELNKKYPNILFDFHTKVLQAGYFDVYNRWILMKDDEISYIKWQKANEEKWNGFMKWFYENGLKLDYNNKFYREQY